MFIKLTEISFSQKKGVFIRGDALIDVTDIRKITKVRDPQGEYCARLSYKSLVDSNDTFVRETPEEIRDMCKSMKGEVMSRVKVEALSTSRVLQIEKTETKPLPKAAPVSQPITEYEFDDRGLFGTNVGENLAEEEA